MPIIHSEDGVPPSKTRIITLGQYYSAGTGAGASTMETFTPPKGKLWKVGQTVMNASAPAGAASGTHEFALLAGDRKVMLGQSVFGSAVSWEQNIWAIADSLQQPATEGGVLAALHHAIYDHNNPLIIRYNNDTNVSAGGRVIYIQVMETSII